MKRTLIATLAAVGVMMTVAKADDAKVITIEQCINILFGLNSLSYVGQQLGDQSRPPSDAKQYKLGPARMTISANINALTAIDTAARSAQQGFQRELPPLPPNALNWKLGEPESPERIAAAISQNNKSQANWEAIIHQPCSVQPGHLKEKELKIGDGPDENAFPPPVLGAIYPIIDR